MIAIASRRERQLLAEFEALDARWKAACGLMRGGDPDGVSPEDAAKYWSQVEAQRDRLAAALRDVRQWVEDEAARCGYPCSIIDTISAALGEREPLPTEGRDE